MKVKMSKQRGKKGWMRVKMSKQLPPAPTASAVGPCPTVIQIVGRPGTGSLHSTIAPPDHPPESRNTETEETYKNYLSPSCASQTTANC